MFFIMERSQFGENLLRLRRVRGISQKTLAKKAGLTQRIIAYYELEKKIDFVSKIERISKALNIPASSLFSYLDNEQTKSSSELELLNPRVSRKLSMILKLDKIDRAKVYEFTEMLLNKEKYKQ